MKLRWALFLAFALLILGSESARAEELVTPAPTECKTQSFKPKLFENRPYFEPSPAAPHDPLTMVLIGKGKRLPYTPNPGSHNFLQGQIGIDSPLANFDGRDGEDAPVGKRCWSFGLWLQGTFPMFLDLSSPGQPVADADYLVDLALKAAYGLSERRRAAFLFAYGHESDHMPSDFEKIASRDPRFETFDVNFEFYKLGAELQSEEKWGVVDIRFTVLIASGEGHQGFYSSGYLKKDGLRLYPTDRNFEPALGLEWMPKATHGFRPYLAYNVGAPTVYNFDKVKDQTEKARITQTLWVALRDFNHNRRGVPDLGLQIYTGRNPFGQMREENSWWAASIGLLIRP